MNAMHNDDFLRQLATLIGEANVAKLIEAWGGRVINIPKGCAYRLAARDVAILREFTGANHAELAAHYDMTERGIRKLLERAGHRRAELLDYFMRDLLDQDRATVRGILNAIEAAAVRLRDRHGEMPDLAHCLDRLRQALEASDATAPAPHPADSTPAARIENPAAPADLPTNRPAGRSLDPMLQALARIRRAWLGILGDKSAESIRPGVEL